MLLRFHAQLRRTLDELRAGLGSVPEDRRAILDRIAAFVRARRAAGASVRLTFICTANSRRSHLGQMWAAAAAAYCGLEDVETYSGGTEATAFDRRAIAALERAGFVVDRPLEAGPNPHVRIRYAEDRPAMEAFSKRHDDPPNPRSDFVAVMVCGDADRGCPHVAGAALRVSLPHEDPKIADGTAEEAARYDECSREIATEMLYLFSRVAAP